MISKIIKQALFITIPYLLLGSIYIAFSDKLVHSLSLNNEMLTQIQTYKGWGFIFLTAALLFILLYRYFKNLEIEKNNLKTSEEKWRSLVTNSPDYIALLDKERKFLFVNKYPDGFTSEQVIGKDSIEYFSDEYKEQFKEIFQKCFNTKTTQKFEVKAFGDNHSIRHYEEYIVPLLSDKNEITFLVIARDITERKTFEAKLKESEERWRTLVTNSPDFIALLDGEGKFLFLNNYSEGFSAEKVIGTDSTDYFSDQYKEAYKKIFAYCSETRTTQKFEFRGYGDSHMLRDYEEFLVPIPTTENKLNFLAIARDITERKQFEIAIKESEEKYRSLFENMSEGLAYCKMIFENDRPVDFIYLNTNPKFQELTGLENVEGKKVSEIIPGIQKDNPELFEIYGRVSIGGKSEFFETFVPGLNEWFSISVYSPASEYFVAVFTIITLRKQTELALQKNRRFLADLIENSGALIYVKDIAGKYELINKKWEEITGLNRKGVLGKTDDMLFSKVDAECFRDNDLAVINSDTTIETEEILTNEKGTRYFISNKFPTLDENGKINGVCGVSTEITERKLAENALAESEERFRNIVEGAPDAIFIRTEDKLVYLNPAACSLFGIDNADELVGTPVFNLIHPDYRAITLERMKKIDKERNIINEQYELQFQGKNGREGWVETKGEPITYDGKKSTLVFLRDITARKKAEEALRLSEERYRTITENIKDVVWVLDVKTERFNYISPSVYQQRGYTVEEILGQSLSDALTASGKYKLEEFTKDRVREFLNDTTKPTFFTDEVEQPCKDGTTIWTEIVTNYYINEMTGRIEIRGVSRDISDRKKIQDALKESEIRYRTITEKIKDVVWVMDANTGNFLYVSPSVYKLRGFTAEEIMTQPVEAALTKESTELLNRITEERITKFLSTGITEYYTDEIEQPCKDGSTVWTEVVTNFYLNEATGHIEVRGVSRDINERKKIQDALKESEERFRTTLDTMLEGCQILDSDLNYFYINDAAEKQNHRPKSELLGNNYLEM